MKNGCKLHEIRIVRTIFFSIVMICYDISWKFSDITTTSMLIGGLSSSGLGSYKIISKEIARALSMNEIKFSKTKIRLRGFWKLVGFLNKA